MLRTERAGNAVVLTLARPDRGNALSAPLVEALLEQVHKHSADPAVTTLVFRSEGPHFCTGFDLSDLAQSTDADLLERFIRVEQLLQAIWLAPVRTVAVANGRAWGAGADLFAACEVRLAAAQTTFRFPGARFGIVLGTRRLALRVGADRARHWVLDSAHIHSEQALQAGFITTLVEPQDLPMAWCAFESCAIDRETATAIRRLTCEDESQRDMAELVASAARPGLKDRMTRYLAALRA